MNKYIVEMKNITKYFPGIVAIDNVTLSIKQGEIFALLGENGAGKSTMMSMLFGMYEPDMGVISINGKEVNITSPTFANDLNIGMVHQHFKLVKNYTVYENIIMGSEPMKRGIGPFLVVDKKKAIQEVSDLALKHGLDVDPTKLISDLSVSEQQRVEILKMLYRNADILIFDEPTAMLTPQEIKAFLKIIEKLSNQGKTIILISHKLDEIKQVANRCAILKLGQLIDIIDPNEMSAQAISNLIIGREVNLELIKDKADFKEEVLQIKNVSYTNKDNQLILKNLNFSIKAGEILAVAGVAGNGQIELAQAIAGSIKVSKGNIIVNKEDITNKSIRYRNMNSLSYIPEDRHEEGLILDYTLEENLILKNYFQQPYANKGVLNNSAFTTTTNKLISEYDIRSSMANLTPARVMSGGNQQKAIIAREIMQDQKLVIFVQPTRGLDVGAIENIQQHILKQRALGKAILLISLELEEVMALADTIAVMYNGEILKVAPCATLSKNQIGQYMMGVSEDEVN